MIRALYKENDGELEPGKIYDVNEIHIGGWYTKVYLDGLDDDYNSVKFNFFDRKGIEMDIFSTGKGGDIVTVNGTTIFHDYY